jgi:hypothetical protein
MAAISLETVQQQLPQLEAMCMQLYMAQVRSFSRLAGAFAISSTGTPLAPTHVRSRRARARALPLRLSFGAPSSAPARDLGPVRGRTRTVQPSAFRPPPPSDDDAAAAARAPTLPKQNRNKTRAHQLTLFNPSPTPPPKQQTPHERAQAEQVLRVFGQSTDYIPHLKAILDGSASPYARVLASSSLLRLVTDHALTPAVRQDMKAYFLAYLTQHGPGMEHFVLTSMVQLLCRTTKLAWQDGEAARRLPDEAAELMQRGEREGDAALYLLGLRVLNALVAEMNAPTPGRTLTQHRKAAVSFRDLSLLKVFAASLSSLRALRDGPAAAAASADKLREQALQLALNCLSFDFVGTCLDESGEDLATIQVPSSWRPLLEDAHTVPLFFDYYTAALRSPPVSTAALECLVRLASVRRSLFGSDRERAAYLGRLLRGTTEILRGRLGLAEHGNYHELCRLLGRLKTNYQLSELVAADCYAEWVSLVAQATVDSLSAWQWASGSVYYLLGLWARLVSSTPYLKGDAPSLLDECVPKITRAYVASRLESVPHALAQATISGGEGGEAAEGGGAGNGGGSNGLGGGGGGLSGLGGGDASAAGGEALDELLDGEEQLADQHDALPYLCRFHYEESAAYICSLMDPLLEAYRQAAHLAGCRLASPLVVAADAAAAAAQAAAAAASSAAGVANGTGIGSGAAAVSGGGPAAGAAAAGADDNGPAAAAAMAAAARQAALAANAAALGGGQGPPIAAVGSSPGAYAVAEATSAALAAAAAMGGPVAAAAASQQAAANAASNTGGGAGAVAAAAAVALPPPSQQPACPGPPPTRDQLRQLAVLEGQLAWLAYIVANVVRGRLSAASGAEAHEATDGALAARCFQLAALSDDGYHARARHGEPTRRRLDGALLTFMQAFRKSYVGEQVMHSSRVYGRLAERQGLRDHAAVLGAMLAKCASNLKGHVSHEPVVYSTLTLFQDLAAGFMSGKVLLRLDAAQQLLRAHSSAAFPFLDHPANSRARTVYYATLARLLYAEESPARFRAFVAPLHAVLSGVAQAAAQAGALPPPPLGATAGAAANAAAAAAAAANGGTGGINGTPPTPTPASCASDSLPPVPPQAAAALRAAVPAAAVEGLFRDLRGVVAATAQRKHYSLVFEWLYPQHIPVVVACLEAWAPTHPRVAHSVLKFVDELCFNRGNRLQFDPSSASGILLFREVSKCVVAYSRHALAAAQADAERAAGGGGGEANGNGIGGEATATTAKARRRSSATGGAGGADAYSRRYKGVWIALQALTRALNGGYVNFGVFDLYGDRALRDALSGALAAALSVPLPDVLAHRKVCRAYFALLETLCHGHVAQLAQQPGETFARLAASLEHGVKSLDSSVSSAAASAADNLAAFYYRHAVAPLQDAAAEAAQQQAVAAASPPPPPVQLSPAARAMHAHLLERPTLFPEVLRALLEVTLFEECSNQWSLSRPMLPLVLACGGPSGGAMASVREQLLAAQPPERREHLSACLAKLMADVGANLDAKNRDKFTQNLTVVRHEYRSRV